jgi:hypothetical protein
MLLLLANYVIQRSGQAVQMPLPPRRLPARIRNDDDEILALAFMMWMRQYYLV